MYDRDFVLLNGRNRRAGASGMCLDNCALNATGELVGMYARLGAPSSSSVILIDREISGQFVPIVQNGPQSYILPPFDEVVAFERHRQHLPRVDLVVDLSLAHSYAPFRFRFDFLKGTSQSLQEDDECSADVQISISLMDYLHHRFGALDIRDALAKGSVSGSVGRLLAFAGLYLADHTANRRDALEESVAISATLMDWRDAPAAQRLAELEHFEALLKGTGTRVRLHIVPFHRGCLLALEAYSIEGGEWSGFLLSQPAFPSMNFVARTLLDEIQVHGNSIQVDIARLKRPQALGARLDEVLALCSADGVTSRQASALIATAIGLGD